MTESRLSRRLFLRSAAMAAAGALAASCAPPAAQVIEKEVPVEKIVKETVVVQKEVPVEKVVKETVVVEKQVAVEKVVTATPAPAKFKEAPAFAELVKAGKLPPVEERVSDEPLVLDPEDRIGAYGGTLITMRRGTDFGHLNSYMLAENFLKYTRTCTGQRPNVVTKWEWNTSGTELTLYWRKGIKWSDGEPLTVDDWIWWWENMVLDEKVGIAPPTGSAPAGNKMQLTKIDDFTVKCTFAATNPLFMPVMTRGTGQRATSFQIIPAHYFKQFHYKFNTSLKDTDVQGLLDRFDSPGRTNFTDIPTIGPWVMSETILGQKGTATRNPYYWKVDPEGNQLPYMDSIVVNLVQNAELVLLSIIAGEVDYQRRDISGKDLPVLKENETKGNYKVYMWKAGSCNDAGVIIHYCYGDKGITDLLWNQKFRQALQYAIDKERINDIVFLGLERPRAFAMVPEGEEFQSERGQKVLKGWENLCVEHDPDKANSLLDEVGILDKNGDGFRERLDGTPLELTIDCDVNEKNLVDSMQLIIEDWGKIGLKTILNTVDGTVLEQRIQECANFMRARGGAASGLVTAPGHWAPIEDTGYGICGRPYGTWYQTGGKKGIAPPPGTFIEKLQQVYRDAVEIVDDAKRNDRVLDGYQIHIDEGPIQIGTVGDPMVPIVWRNNLHNVSVIGGLVNSATYAEPGSQDPEQWFKT